MKNIYLKPYVATPKFMMLLLTALLGFTFASNAQVRVNFTQRTSQYTPTKKIYNIKGDFAMMGNTNLTLQNYGDLTQNGNNTMVYVDVDNASLNGIGGTPTFNSSSATLGLSTENGAVPSCSNIIYAGLYWTGRAANSSPSNNTFTVNKNVPASVAVNNVAQSVGDDQSLTYGSYSLNVTRGGSTGDRYPIYTFSGGGNTYAFRFTNVSNGAVAVSINGGNYNTVTTSINSSGGSGKTAVFATPYQITDGGLTISITQLRRDGGNSNTTSTTETTSFADLTMNGTAMVNQVVSKTFDKRKIQFKGPGASTYTEFTANANDIYYPTNQDDYMYSAYTEVTEYVKTHGIGEYTAGDIALIEGNGGGTGYYGGWGLIVVYENSKMKYRDVTIFDGHAYVIGGEASNQLPISGFNTVQAGPVGIKLGVMAGEGDSGISGDYFQIQRQDNNNWQSLSHSNNSTSNFFNSSIQTSGARTPNLVNNTGLDISMFNLPNTNNGLITNNQTATTFRYGSTQDTYIIFAIAMAVDAYVPDIEGNLAAVSINNQPVPPTGPYTALPGQEMEFKIQVRNRGTEPINNAVLTIPIPYNTEYVANSATRQIFYTPAPTPNSLAFNPAVGSNGSVIWNIGTLPVPATPDTVLGELTFKISVTTDCELLKNAQCQNIVAVNGSFTGTGAITGISFNEKDLIQGYSQNGNCQGTAIAAPLLVNVNAADYVNTHCQSTPPITAFTFCSTGAAIPITAVAGSFPNGSTFFNQYPVGPNAIQYTINNPFPATVGTTTYYAIPPGALQGCYFQFTITVTTITSTPTVNSPLNYCQNASAAPLTATPSAPGLMLFYYTSQNGSPQVSITPSTATVGSTTYYVAEAASSTCIGPKVPIVVNVYPAPQAVAPAASSVNGCGTAAITGLTYSTSPVTITLAQFQAAGGNITNAAAIGNYTISYVDTITGTCPKLVTRTFKITSACGNTNVTQTITISDTTAPIISGLPTGGATTIQCPATPNWAAPTASDNCEGVVTLTSSDTTVQGTCGGSYVITRTWTATDLCGNTATATQVFNVVDTTAPVISQLPAPSTISCPATPSWTTPTATDGCGGTVTLTSNDVTTPGSCPSAYTIVRTWTATDACGNQSTASQSITVQDSTAPAITAQAQNLTIQCTAGNQNALTEWLNNHGGATASDACSAVTWTNNFTGVTGGCAASVPVIFTATDACGNTATTTATFTVNDNVAPVAPAAPANVTVACVSEVPANVTLTAQDNCAGAITAQGVDVTTPGSCPNSFKIVRTWTFADACGNMSSVSQTINVNDTIAPVAPAAPANVNVSCGANVPANVTLTAQDNCSGAITAQGVDVTTPGSCGGTYTIVRTWTFTDACGNASSVSQTINVSDTVAPVVPTAPANVTVACASEVPANVTLTATDNCQGAITAQGVDVTTPGSCPNSFTVVRTWTFVDACGNTSSVSQTITVNDTIAPVAPAAPANVTASCGAEVPANVTLTAQDNCSGAITAQGVDVQTPGQCAGSYTIVRTWTFTDACGNSSSVSQTINVSDTVAPVVPAAPANVTVACASEVPANATLTATDNCQGAITAQGVDVTTPGSCANSFVIVRTWTFADACGNASSVSQTITVNDTVAPTISALPAATTIDCPATPQWATPTATDNCTGAVTLTFADTTIPGNCANSYALARTWTATDACGNTATATQTINVQDITAPTITAQAQNLTIQCGAGNQNALNQWLASNGGAAATDSCSAVTWTNNYNGIGNDCTAAVTVIFTATDACGNASTTSATFTVQDTTAPVAPAAPAAVTVQCAADVPSNATLTATDNCAGNIAVQGVDVTTPGQCAGSYTIVRTWTFTDACANSTSVSQTITVNDTIAPVAPQAPATVTVACASEVPANIELTATDNCQGAITVSGVDVTTPGACANSFTIVRTWTFADACGNTTSVSQTINVNDTVAPVAPAAPANVTAQCASEVPANVTLTAQDNCQGAITALGVDVITPGACANSFTIVRTWTFADACGNASSVSQTINVNDTTAPVAPAAPANVTASCGGDVPANVTLTAQDNCQGAITAQGVDVTTPGACAGSYTIVRTWTFADACGNTSSVSQTITVSDTTAPVAPAAPADVTVACASEVPANVTLTATDNCGGEISAQGVDVTTPGQCANAFVVVRTWTFADACGNTSSVSQTITVNDNIAPTISQLPAATTIDCPATPQFAQATATDNCAGAVTLTFEDVTTPGSCPSAYAITRTWTATDACGNTATASQTINVQDLTAPVITAQAQDLAIQCGAGNANALNEWLASNGGATATDSCSAVTWTNNYNGIGNDCTAAVTVIFTATDACGNASTTSATFTVSDNTAPVAPEAPAALTVQCAADVPANVTLTATDNCAGNIAVQGVDVTTPGQCAGSYTIVRTWTFTDACANSVSVSQTITVNDTTAPVAPAAPETVNVSCVSEVPANVTLTAQDNCQGAITAQGVDVVTPGSCPNSFTVVRTWTFVDACGNSSSVSQTINVNDTIAPVAPEAPANVTAQCGADVPANVALTATDNCGDQITAQGVDVTTPGACEGSYTIVRTWTFTDACGNSSNVAQTISVNDTTAPVAPAAPADVTVACAGEVPANVTLTATDNCGGQISAEGVDVTTPGQCANAYVIVRTWTFADACGNTSSVSQTINVNDNIAPVFAALPEPTTIDCPATPVFAQASATDNCAGEVTLTFQDVNTPGQCAGSYSIVRTWTATDACGNSSTATQTINVQDVTAPVISTQASDVAIQCGAGNENALTEWLNNHGGAVAADTCSDVAWTNNYAGIGNDCSAAVTVIFTATDACGNASSTSATFTISDTTAPVIGTEAQNVTIECPGVPQAHAAYQAWLNNHGGATATDNCSTVTWTHNGDGHNISDCNAFATVIFTATDACGNQTTTTATFTVNDTQAPVAPEAPATVTVACASDVPANVTLTAIDECRGPITATGVDATTPGACAGTYTIVRTWTFADVCGNTSSVSQTINVVDDVAPTAPAAPENVAVACQGDVPAAATLVAADNCGDQITGVAVDVTTPGQCAGSFTIVRTWTFTDACGNSSTVSQTINVNDNVAPVFAALPQPSTIECSATPEFAQASATDNCGGEVTLAFEDANTPGQCAGSYTIVRTWTATDACGNAATATQTINVQDTTAPVIATQAQDLAIQCGNGNENTLQDWLNSHGGAVANDTCSDVTWTNNYTGIGNDCSAAVTVIFTATDACGNAATTSATYTISDTVAPVAPAAPADVTVACAAEVPANATLTATDNCLGTISVQGVDATTPGACAGTYTIVRTWTFTDACGNASSVSQTINVIDNVAPTAPAAPADVTLQCGDALPENATLTATDNCGEQIAALGVDVVTPGACAGTSTIVRTWTFTDACGNASSVSQTINVTDTVAPVVPTAPESVTAQCAAEIPAAATLTAVDACSGNVEGVLTEVNTPGACAGSFTLVRTWTFTDACGNVSTVSQTISVNDTTAPVLPANVPADVTVSCASEVPAAITLTATDNCSADPITATAVDSVTPGSCANSFTIVRTWTFADACGNTSAATQTITVNDTTAPTFNEAAPADVTLSCEQIPAAATLTAVDNCGNTPVAVTMTESTLAGTCAGAYTLVRTWSATDACGNVASVSQAISVVDTTAPTFVEAAPEATITAECGAIPAPAVFTAVDGCNATPITVAYAETSAPNKCPLVEVITRTWTATDACGNTATYTQTVNVQDTTAPTANEPLEPVVNVTCDAIPAVPQLTFSDSCSAVMEPSFNEVISEVENGAYTITWTWAVTDLCGNLANFTQVVNVTIGNSETTVNSEQCNQDSSLTLDLNTLLPAGTPAGGTFVNVDGITGLNGSILAPYQGANGTYTIDYVIEDATCPRVVHIEMVLDDQLCLPLPACEPFVHNAFSPNNDGINEVFFIENFDQPECIVSNSVEIYNRWGILVYETKNYNNTDRAFRGVSEGRVTLKKDDELPTGTYFYIITYKKADGTGGKKDGYLYLSR